MTHRLGRLVAPAVFGAFDGVVTVLGVLFALSASPHELVKAGVGLSVAGAVSMAGGQWLSDNDNGFGAATVIGLCTGAGTLVPVVPYAVWHGAGAAVAAAVLCLAVAALVAWLKTVGRPYPTLLGTMFQTYSLLLVAGAATLLCAWATGAVG